MKKIIVSLFMFSLMTIEANPFSKTATKTRFLRKALQQMTANKTNSFVLLFNQNVTHRFITHRMAKYEETELEATKKLYSAKASRLFILGKRYKLL